MCGILAYFNPEGISKKEIVESIASLQSIKHRGPDGEGVLLLNTKSGESTRLRTNDIPEGAQWDVEFDNLDGEFNLFFGHRRLSIFDTSIKGHQPMTDTHSGNVIIYNGEVYNFKEIRDELISNGHAFSSDSDTEVILTAYRVWGENCFSRFNGMWSMILWLADEKKLLVCNDRFGVKPMYFLNANKKLFFVSEIKQFLAYSSFSRTLNEESIRLYLKDGLLDTSTETFYQDVKRFSSGHYAKIDLQVMEGLEQIAFYKLPKQLAIDKNNNYVEEVRGLLESAVELRTRADVNWGVSVSGGLDSSLIYSNVKNLVREGSNLNTFSAIFPGSEGDESEHIFNLLKFNNQNGNTVNPLDEFEVSDLVQHIYHQDFPIISTSFYAEWCVSRLVRKSGIKVVLNGQGADEVFAGYHMHFYLYLKTLILKGKLVEFLGQVKAFAGLKNIPKERIFRIVFGDLKLWLKFKLLTGQKDMTISRLSVDNLYQGLKNDIYHYQLPTNLRSDDRDGMAFGVESRHPFMDYRLIDFGMKLPNRYKINEGWQKWILREIGTNLPDNIRYRKDKMGYTSPQNEILNKSKTYLDEARNSVKEYESISTSKDRLAFFGIWKKKFS